MNRTFAFANRKPLFVLRIFSLLLFAGLFLAGCADDDDALEIVGIYDDDFGTTHAISSTEWAMDFGGFGSASFAILQFSNSADFLVGQNGADNSFSPDLFSRFDWTNFASELYFCQGTFAAASEAEAAAADTSDATDPTSGGCGGFSWSRLTPQ